MEHAVPSFSEVPLFPEIFQWNEPKKHVPFTTQPEFPESLGKWKTPYMSSKMFPGRFTRWVDDVIYVMTVEQPPSWNYLQVIKTKKSIEKYQNDLKHENNSKKANFYSLKTITISEKPTF